MKTIFTLSLLIIFFISCTKNNSSTGINFRGIVVDYSTGQRVSNANVIVTFTNSPSRDSVTDYTATTTSNANGEYEVTLQNNPYRYYYSVSGNKLGYTLIGWRCESSGYRLGTRLLDAAFEPYFDTVYLDKSSILNLNINNIVPSNSNDTLELSIIRAKSCSTTGIVFTDYKYKNLKLIGGINNHIFSDTFSLKATSNVSVDWKVRNNGVVGSGTQNIVATEFGTTNVAINY